MVSKQVPRSSPNCLINYGAPINYSGAEAVEFKHWPVVSGVYLLAENGLFYIGQSADVAGRFASHRLNPVNCKFNDPHCVLLAHVPDGARSWRQNARRRLVAEARFITAAISMGLPLTNTLTPYKRAKLLSQFPDLSCEREHIAQALQTLGAE